MRRYLRGVFVRVYYSYAVRLILRDETASRIRGRLSDFMCVIANVVSDVTT